MLVQQQLVNFARERKHDNLGQCSITFYHSSLSAFRFNFQSSACYTPYCGMCIVYALCILPRSVVATLVTSLIMLSRIVDNINVGIYIVVCTQYPSDKYLLYS